MNLPNVIKIEFNSTPFKIGPELFLVKEPELKNLPSMENVSIEVAQRDGGALIKSILKQCPLSLQRKNVYVDVRVQHLKKGDMPHKSGWHCDTTISPTYSGELDVHHLFVTGKAALTTFIGESVTLNYDTTLLPPAALEQLQTELAGYSDLKTVTVPSNTWVTYGPTSFHQVKAADFEETRLLIRIRETNLDNLSSGFILEPGKETSIADILRDKKDPPMILKKTTATSFLNWLFQGVPELNELNFYTDLLKESFKQYPPPYCFSWYGELYKELSLDKLWFSSALLKNALAEAAGAKKAKIMASQTPKIYAEDANLFLTHANDELKHAYYFRKLFMDYFLNLVSVSPDLLMQVDDFIKNTKEYIKKPPEHMSIDTLTYADKIIQINIGEIRSLVQALLLKTVITAMMPEVNEIKEMLEVLISDEVTHIHYTAKLINRFCHDLDIKILFNERVHDLNKETLKETGGSAEGYHITRLNQSIIRLDEKNQVNEKAIHKTVV